MGRLCPCSQRQMVGTETPTSLATSAKLSRAPCLICWAMPESVRARTRARVMLFCSVIIVVVMVKARQPSTTDGHTSRGGRFIV